MQTESLSLESTLESPSKPSQEKNHSKKHKKSSFSEETDNNNNTLDFDKILNIVFPTKENKKNKKLIGNKRKNEINTENYNINNINKSKIIYLFHNIDNNRTGKNRNNDDSNNNGKNKSKKIKEDLYSIYNFETSTAKIKEKTMNYNIKTPKYEELNEEFFEDNNIEVSK